MATVFQHFGRLPWKTAYENTAFGLAMAGAERAVIQERVAHYLELVGLDFQRHYRPAVSDFMARELPAA